MLAWILSCLKTWIYCCQHSLLFSCLFFLKNPLFEYFLISIVCWPFFLFKDAIKMCSYLYIITLFLVLIEIIKVRSSTTMNLLAIIDCLSWIMFTIPKLQCMHNRPLIVYVKTFSNWHYIDVNWSLWHAALNWRFHTDYIDYYHLLW